MAKPESSAQEKHNVLDRNIDRFRQQVAGLKGFIMGAASDLSLEEFDLATEGLIAEVFGSSSSLLETYEYAQLGEAGGLVNLPGEAPEATGPDDQREVLRQRQRVLESCIADLEARRAQASSDRRHKRTTGPTVSDFMARDIRSVPHDATLRDAGKLLQQWHIGSLLVESGDEFIGSITETELSREVVANGVDPETTTVKTCMREPIMTIESRESVVEAVRCMKEKATRHVCVTESGKIVGLISVSDILRYYSGVT
ncbi:MAG: CBS domain-containing protein [Nitrospira sp.]|nr:CBS domain-containing protein [Nitrospira sp.]MDD9859591.1 CBS domain-containing protein [Nitrospira sp.]